MNNQEIAYALRQYGETVTTLYGTPINDSLFLKAADALEESEPIVKAHWIYAPCDGVWVTFCSHCGHEETGENLQKYKGCPMCRAKMTHINRVS